MGKSRSACKRKLEACSPLGGRRRASKEVPPGERRSQASRSTARRCDEGHAWSLVIRFPCSVSVKSKTPTCPPSMGRCELKTK
ncbi:hypothetical protein I79_011517 [Cricetulus griseus]|uniref:Uncharacterized protein n=1 Tax=Cricetulus griseus TaxID=10029 RepID=G3HLC9_CRIGR|nr:hypothetical protein I79_011517 [Cricetulus griseus]